ncbi:P-loop containing nucleoside triphosphate hydrolase protein [Pseudovirgaria hyperparasitica]|uniref:P-loop containing nucleoside triphosphate hydrolase protein n=1 Tax=Pseudovirgaria hyperparasitica TaxID=470096 RepID=A0A6A6WBB2_9PEZI|nr:P-loop containing nucleoside triphosphate hydrolase protein [Pseudovirgaria hyperparasitica]KAF2759855.1 P-loop containing nucleoside triphosphate hydrolase protein [Pseudovirgaria hyperparasitica]
MTKYLVFVIGAPGSGKGSLCHKLRDDFGYSHLSIGDHLREMVASDSDTISKEVMNCIADNELLDITDLEPIMTRAINTLYSNGAKVVLLDGFPRELNQALHMEKCFRAPDLVLHLQCEEPLVHQRYLTRAIPGRNDTTDVFKKRYKEFVRLNSPILAEYNHRGILVTVDSSGDVNATYQKLLSALRETVLDPDRDN